MNFSTHLLISSALIARGDWKSKGLRDRGIKNEEEANRRWLLMCQSEMMTGHCYGAMLLTIVDFKLEG